MKTTAQLRNEAYDAEQALDWGRAAKLYQAAIDAYPPHNPKSQLNIDDKKNLAKKVEQCLREVAA